MQQLYKSVDVIGNRLFHRYYKDGETRLDIIKDFPLKLFIKSTTEAFDSKSIYGDKLSRIDFSSLSDAKEFLNAHKGYVDIFGQTNFAYQFINITYPDPLEFNISEFTVVSLDIETKFERGEGFPYPKDAKYEISSITVKVRNDDMFISFGTKDYEPIENSIYHKASSESEMLIQFMSWWMKTSPDIVTGWNVNGSPNAFDMPYIVNRISKVLGESWVNRLSPYYKHSKNCVTYDEEKGAVNILGVTIYDYMELYKRLLFDRKLESYRLDFVAEYELNINKIDYSDEYSDLMDLYDRNHQLYIEYNIHDVRLVDELDKKLNLIYLAITLGYLGKIKLSEMLGKIRFWENVIYTKLGQENIQIPPSTSVDDDFDTSFEGAYVKEPIPGLYNWVTSFDLTSLYPSIIMALGISPETFDESYKPPQFPVDDIISMSYDTSDLKQLKCSMAANGYRFHHNPDAIMPRVTSSMFADRKAYKNKMIDAEKAIEQLKKNGETDGITKLEADALKYDILQMAYKISLNSLYGVLGNSHFRYYNREIAEGITLTGQAIIRYISNHLNDFINKISNTSNYDYIITNDTDSAYVNMGEFVKKSVPANTPKDKTVEFLDRFIKKNIDPFLDEKFKAFSEYLNFINNTLSMKREAIADRAIWRGKKNYIIQVHDNEGIRYSTPKLKAVGVETARSSTPKLVKTALLDCYDILLNKTEDDLIKYVSAFDKKFKTSPLSAIAFPRGVSDINKWLDSTTRWKSGTPIHVKAAICYNQIVNDLNITSVHQEIRSGDKIKFVYLKPENPYQTNVMAFVTDIPKEFKMDEYIDINLQYEKTFYNPLVSFSLLRGFSPTKVNTLYEKNDADSHVVEVRKLNERKPAKQTKPINKLNFD